MATTRITIDLSPDELKDLIDSCLDSKIQKLTTPTPPPPEEFISRKVTAGLLNITLPTLSDWSKKRGIIPFYRIGSRVLYKRSEVEAAVIKAKTIKHRREECYK